MKTYRSFGKYCLLAISLMIVIIWGQGKLTAQGEIPGSIPPLRQCSLNSENYAGCLTQQGHDYLNRGDARSALESWQQAEIAYPENSEGVIGSQINQGMALQGLGRSRKSCQLLLKAIGREENYPICDGATAENLDLSTISPSLVNAIALRNLGEVLRAIGKLDDSREVLETSLAIAQTLNNFAEIDAVRLELGNTARASYKHLRNLYQITDRRKDRKDAIAQAELALAKYRQVTERSPILHLKSELNQLSLLVNFQDWLKQDGRQTSAPELIEQGEILQPAIDSLLTSLQHSSVLTNLPPSKFAVDARINVALSLSQLDLTDRALNHANAAAKIADTLQQPYSQSYALGTLGKLYDKSGALDRAETFTNQAIFLAKNISAWDISSQWQWQLGKIYTKQQNIPGAIAAYDQAVEDLEKVRRDLLAIEPDMQLNFRDEVEPVYRELLDLLLQPQARETDLNRAIQVASSLQLAELENFIQCDRASLNLTFIDEAENPPAAIIYPIIFRDRLEVIVKRSQDQTTYSFTSLLKPDELKKTVWELQKRLSNHSPERAFLPQAQKLYDWLIRPAKDNNYLPESGTLVFVLDSGLQNIPMAVLHDRDRYLIETYSLAVSSGAQLPEPTHLEIGAGEILLGGISEKAPSYAEDNLPALTAVTTELVNIENTVSTQKILNEAFTLAAWENKMTAIPFSVLHLATHGQFSSDPEQTFIYAWDEKVTVKKLDYLLEGRGKISREPIQLLVLSACETAQSDSRSVLGIAGIALKANARSVLASLWKVQDADTAEFMGQFYRQLGQLDMTKAEALRQVQLEFLAEDSTKHPYYWSAFILAGNWL